MKKLFAVMCILASSGIGLAQGVTTGALEGVVSDPTGVPMPGATVQAELLTTGTTYRTTTDGSGRFKIVNARVGWRWENSGTELALWGRNLTDERYYPGSFDAPVQDGRMNSYPAEPRTWGVTLRVDF